MIKLQKLHTCPIYTNRYDSSNRWSIGTDGTIGTNRKGCHSNSSIGEQKQVEMQTCYENSSFYQPSIQNKFAFTPSRKALIVVMNIPPSISQPRKTISLSHKVETR